MSVLTGAVLAIVAVEGAAVLVALLSGATGWQDIFFWWWPE